MVLLALFVALLLNHYRPCLPPWLLLFSRPLHWIAQQVNAGEHQHGKLAWWLVQIPALSAVGLLWLALRSIHPLLSLLLDVAFLCPALSFQRNPLLLSAQHAHHSQHACVAPSDDNAHTIVPPFDQTTTNEQIAQLLEDSVHELFGIVLYFFICSPVGPLGIVLYQLTQSMAKNWQTDEHGVFAEYAHHMRQRLDWLPVRITALSFAIAGNFEDALFHWRNNISGVAQHIALASGAGALGITISVNGHDFGNGPPATADDLPAAINLIWRSLAIWLLLLSMMTLARLTA